MKLGAMLVRDGRLTPAQIDQAVALQGKRGGRMGTILVEMRLLDADTLTVYLGLELGIPIATRAALERAKRAAVRLLTPELAERFLCVPLVVQDRQLIAAMRDPHDLLALDELGTATGCRLIPRVAPEVRLYYYLERYYGVPRPDRYRMLGDWVAEGPKRGGADAIEPPPPPLPGLPPELSRPVVVATPAPPLRIAEAEEIEADELAMELEADAEEPAEAAGAPPPPPAPAQTEAAGPAPAAARPAVPPPPSEAAPPTPALEIDDAVAQMAAAASRAEVASTLVAYARGIFDVAVLTVVRDDIAFGWKGFGRDLDEDRIEALMIPMESSPMFRAATESNDLFVGAAPPTSLHAHLFKVLRTQAPRQAVVAPVVIRDRVVNVLYAHCEGEKVVGEIELDGLRHVTRAAANAYARMIALQKKGG